MLGIQYTVIRERDFETVDESHYNNIPPIPSRNMQKKHKYKFDEFITHNSYFLYAFITFLFVFTFRLLLKYETVTPLCPTFLSL